MKNLLSLTAALAILALAPGVAKADAPAHVDLDFGKGGRAALPAQVEATWDTVQLPDGRIVVPGRNELIALLPSGQIDSSFGVGGFAPLLLPPGAIQASIADLMVDPQGRLVVVGNSAFPATRADGISTNRQEILIERFNANGSLDAGFGDGGFVTSDFGVPPPEGGGVPSVLARYAATDPAGRVVISAQRLAGHQFYKGYDVNRYESFVTRLDGDGKVDGGFASGGVLPLPGSETLGRPLVDAQGGFYIQSFPMTGSVLMHIQPNGQADPGFGQGGGRPLPSGTGSPVLLDGSGRLILWGDLQGWKERRLANGVLIKRLLPNGSLDRSFGRGGAISFRMPRLYTARIGLDEQGRILVGAALKKRAKKGRHPALPAGLTLSRLRPDGALDTSFGRRGVVGVRFPGNVELNIESLGVSNGAALLGGGGCSRSSCDRALVRIVLGTD